MCFPFFSKNEVTGSGFREGRGGTFVLGTQEDLNENVKREMKKKSGKRILCMEEQICKEKLLSEGLVGSVMGF